MHKNSVTILGCGTSSGVPYIGNTPGGDWGACDPKEPKNYRTRASVYVEYDGLKILVDASPDLRQQYLDNNLTGLDAVILTHEHADHASGVDNLRRLYFTQGSQRLDIYASGKTLREIKGTFGYLFKPHPTMPIYPHALEEHEITGDFDIQGRKIQVIEQPHGVTTSLGLRFGNMAYCTDFHHLPDQALEKLQGLDLWIADALRYKADHPSHSWLEQTLGYVDQIKPKQTVITHMSYDIDYNEVQKHLPPTVTPAYDGRTIQF